MTATTHTQPNIESQVKASTARRNSAASRLAEAQDRLNEARQATLHGRQDAGLIEAETAHAAAAGLLATAERELSALIGKLDEEQEAERLRWHAQAARDFHGDARTGHAEALRHVYRCSSALQAAVVELIEAKDAGNAMLNSMEVQLVRYGTLLDEMPPLTRDGYVDTHAQDAALDRVAMLAGVQRGRLSVPHSLPPIGWSETAIMDHREAWNRLGLLHGVEL